MWIWLAGGGGLLAVGLVILLIVLLGGDGKFGKVQVGMTQQQVEAAVGKPDFILLDVPFWADPPIQASDLRDGAKTNKVKSVLIVLYENGKVKDREVLKGKDLNSKTPPRILRNHPNFK